MQHTDRHFAAADRALLDELESGFDGVRRRAREHLVCAKGCSDCCIGPFPITRLDAWRLRRGIAALHRARPEVAAAIQRAAVYALDAMREGFPGDLESGRLSTDEATLDRFFEQHSELPCPVLDPDSGACRLYDDRPISCRTYGPPVAFENEPAPHCTLCFNAASSAEIEACRWSPDPGDREQVLLRELGVSPGDDWEMLIAHAVANEPGEEQW